MIITDDLELNDNFTWFVRSVNYDWENSKVNVECIFQEGKFRHSRTFEYIAKHNMLEQDIIELLNSEDWYKPSDVVIKKTSITRENGDTVKKVSFRSGKTLYQRFTTFVKRLWVK